MLLDRKLRTHSGASQVTREHLLGRLVTSRLSRFDTRMSIYERPLQRLSMNRLSSIIRYLLPLVTPQSAPTGEPRYSLRVDNRTLW